MSGEQLALEVVGLEKRFGGAAIIRKLSLDVRAGERHGVIGPNGAGKSTLFHLITGYHAPTAGRIRFRGTDIAGLAPHHVSRLGLTRSFQITALFRTLSVFENLRIATMARHGSRFGLFRLASAARAINRDAETVLEKLRLRGVRDVPAAELSYSDQRALEIGMALATGGDVVLLDEPTAGMSHDESLKMAALIREVTEGKTLIVIEHDMDVVFSLCDRISVLVYGEIILTGDPAAIRASDAVRQAYLGEITGQAKAEAAAP